MEDVGNGRLLLWVGSAGVAEWEVVAEFAWRGGVNWLGVQYKWSWVAGAWVWVWGGIGVKLGAREQEVSVVRSGSLNFTPPGGGAAVVELVVGGKRGVAWCTVDGGETGGSSGVRV